jgi:short-subunit dehydrogenase
LKRKLSPDFRARYGPWAIVAGASAGLGAAFAEQIADQGLNLLLVARRQDLLEQVGAHLISTYGVQVRTVALDLARDDATARVAAAAGGLDVGLLVYNAAYSAIGPFLDRPLEEHLREIATNCRTPLGLAYAFGQPMRKRGRGGIILMSSLSALQGSALIANYAATKAYNLLLAEGLWEELRGAGVDVMACRAGAVSTPNYLESLSRAAQATARQIARPPLGAMPAEAVVAETLASLGSGGSVIPGFSNRAAAFIMGHVLPRGLAVRIMGRVLRRLYAGDSVDGRTADPTR